ncbi:APC family permease [Streptosporangium lutulentum]
MDAGSAGDGRGTPGGPDRRPAVPADRLPAEPRHEERRPVRDGRRRAEGRRGAGGHRRRFPPHRHGQLHPFFPYGVSGAFTGAATVFFAVFGYDAMSTAAEESRDARRHMPKAIMYSLAIAMVLYVLACLVLTGMQKYTEIDRESGFSTAFSAVGLRGLANVIAVGAIIGILTVMFTFMLGVTRVWFAMSRDGLLPKWFAKTHPTRHVPTRVTWIVGVISAIMAGFLPIVQVAELTNIGILLAFVVVCAAVIVLHYRRPDLPRTFRCPGMPVVPAIGVLFSLWLITFLQWQTWVRFAAWFVVGLIVYFGYSYRHSALAGTETASSGEGTAGGGTSADG